MDNEKKTEMPADDSWFDELLARPQMGEEISADEHAVTSAGLTDPADLELEQIIQETHDLADGVDAVVTEESFEEILAEIQEEIAPEAIPAEIQEEIVLYAAEETPAETQEDVSAATPEEITAEIPEESSTQETMVIPSAETEVATDATLAADPTLSDLWELAAAEEPLEEEEPRILPETPFMDDEYKETFGQSGEELELVFADMREIEKKPARQEPVSKPVRRKPGQKKKTSNRTREKQEPKGRPKRKNGYGLLGIPHIISTFVWLAIVLAIGVSLGRLVWVCATDVLAFGRESRECIVTISENDNIDTIAGKLKTAGLIRYPGLFKMYADITDAEEEITAGTFTLNTKYDYMALVNYMSAHSSSREEVEILIPEGYTCAQIFALLEEKKVCSAEDLKAYAADGALGDYWFLEGVERGTGYCLEGYLFPDTYKFYTNDKPGRVLSKFLDNFEYRFTDIMKEKLDVLNERMAKVMSGLGYPQDYVESHKFTMRDIVIIASMIEKEKANDAESYDVSSVIYNRLTNAKEYPYLNIDATIIYALDGNIDPETGKTKPLTAEDLKLEHPYNTYTEKGMIPGPISNPGRNSLDAALDPNPTDYYFYVFNPNTGVHLFAKNAKDHQKNVDYVKSLEDKE